MTSGWGGNNQWGAQSPAQSQANNSMIAFINDDSVVANYPVQAGYTVALINMSDPKKSRMYIKSVETNGMPNQTQIFEIKNITPRQDGDGISRQEYEELKEQYVALSNQMSQVISALQGHDADGKERNRNE